MKKIAAIDIGSNAVRILICYVIQSENQDIFQKNSYLRLPLRLGEDSFRDGIISDKKIKTLSEALISFKYIMRVHNVDEYQIYATSALRESKNYLKVISEVEETSGLKINLINGLKEAKIIAKGNPLSKLEFNKTYLYVDVGGGSTEYSILRRGLDKKSKLRSFINCMIALVSLGRHIPPYPLRSSFTSRYMSPARPVLIYAFLIAL